MKKEIELNTYKDIGKEMNESQVTGKLLTKINSMNRVIGTTFFMIMT